MEDPRTEPELSWVQAPLEEKLERTRALARQLLIQMNYLIAMFERGGKQ